MKGSELGTEKLTLRHVRSSWRCSRARCRWSPLRLYRFALLMLYAQVDDAEALRFKVVETREVSAMFRIDESRARADGVTEITRATLISVSPLPTRPGSLSRLLSRVTALLGYALTLLRKVLSR
jgi:hypothetical protein